jgi:hypothetical protein
VVTAKVERARECQLGPARSRMQRSGSTTTGAPGSVRRPGPRGSASFHEWERLIREHPCPRCRGKRIPCSVCGGWRVDPEVAVPEPDNRPPPIVHFTV